MALKSSQVLQVSFSPVCVHFCMCDSHTVTPAIINQTTPIRFHLMFRAFLFIYMETQDIFRQCHHLTICFLTSDLTNSTRFTIRNKNQRTLIVRRAGLSRKCAKRQGCRQSTNRMITTKITTNRIIITTPKSLLFFDT